MWETNRITNTWPSARLSGTSSTKKEALDFIWKTDVALSSPDYCGNNRQFEKNLKEWLGYTEFSLDNFHKDYEAWNKLTEQRGQFSLHHLKSMWVCSSYVYGPDGPVSPSGKVSLSKNFGKYPDIEEIEEDLSKLAKEFSWLEFQLFLWDSCDESEAVDRGDLPDFGWELKDGSFNRILDIDVFHKFEMPDSPKMSLNFLNTDNETTWSIESLKRIFKDRI